MNSEIDTTLLLFFVPKLVDMYIVFDEKLLVYLFRLQNKQKKKSTIRTNKKRL